ncbi:MAG: 5-bromo-4-chloroindolyl phosphate hydrolysis family protein [Rhodobacteraceae bacterium]|nr:5-bromo-4-chloroindolyl phosphate hydrolysis family protein [Paracoccaceae bacterium]
MAQRFGGKYSPEGTNASSHEERPAFQGARVDPVGARSNVLFVPPVILAFTSLGGATELAIGLVGAAVLILGAWLLREGLRAEAAWQERKVARRPALPRKVLAALLVGIGTALAAWKTDPALLASVIFGVAATGLHLAAFGLDPMRDKGMEGIDTFQQDRVAKTVDEAEHYLAGMSDAVRRAGDRQVEARVERFQTKVREMIRTVEDDPRDLTAARKYLGVYLMGARDASVKFADVYSRSRDPGARSDFMMLLTDLEESFNAKTQKLLLDDNSDLNIEIEVLRDRLQQEGVRLG